MFGIVWGITSVILLVGLGIGFNIQQREQLRTIGTDIAIIFGGKTGMPSGGYAAGRDMRMTIDDVIAIQREANLVKNVSPELRRTVSEVSPGTPPPAPSAASGPSTQNFRPSRSNRAASSPRQTKIKGAASSSSAPNPTANSSPASPSSAKPSWSRVIPTPSSEFSKTKNRMAPMAPVRTTLNCLSLTAPWPATSRPPSDPASFRLDQQHRRPARQPRAPRAGARAGHPDLAERHHFDPADKEAVWVWEHP